MTTDSFQAHLTVDGAAVQINASSMTTLQLLLARLTLANGAQTASGVSADEKAAVVGNVPTPAPTPKPAAVAKAATPAPTPPTATAAPVAAQQPKAEPSGVTYEDVKKVVNALYAIEPQHAVDALAKFNVKNGKELDPKDWVKFVEDGRAQLESLKATESLKAPA